MTISLQEAKKLLQTGDHSGSLTDEKEPIPDTESDRSLVTEECQSEENSFSLQTSRAEITLSPPDEARGDGQEAEPSRPAPEAREEEESVTLSVKVTERCSGSEAVYTVAETVTITSGIMSPRRREPSDLEVKIFKAKKLVSEQVQLRFQIFQAMAEAF